MFSSSKLDLDKHVEECLSKINNETERNLRCLSFAKQYFKLDRFEDARRYVSTYLSARPNSPEAHCLLGKTLEMLGRKEAALQAYTTSLRLEPKQNNIVLKVCELLASDDVEMDQSGAKYFCEMAQSVDPHNPALFNLKQRILTLTNDDPKDVSNLILKELEGRPTDIKLRVRLLKHLLQNNMVKEAYKHAFEIESKDLPIFHNSLTWYEAVAETIMKYQKSVALPKSLGWDFWFLSVSVSDKLVTLSLDEHNETIKLTTEYVTALFNFDQTLFTASVNISDCPDKQLLQEFLNHYSAQLRFHLSTLVFKQAQKDLIKFKEATNITLPLLFASYHSLPPDLQSLWFNHAPEDRRNYVRRWRREAAFRCSQTGHILQAAAKDRKTILLEKANQYSVGMWREQLYKKLFITRDQQLKMKTSYFLTDPQLLDLTLRLPEHHDLLKYDEEAQLNYPNSLHHHIWIAMNNKLSEVKCTVFEGLHYSVKNLKNCGAESLNVLDLQSFIYCATLCAKYNLESNRHVVYYNLDKPSVLPVAVTRELGTLNQNTFFKAAYKMYKNEYDSALDQLRLTLVEGIKVVRCVDHGLDVKLLVALARTFVERSKSLTKQSEIEDNEARAELYWKAALPILEKMKNNQAVSYPPNKLFNYRSKDLSMSEICDHIEAGKLFTGCQLMKRKDYEKALRIFETLKDPFASFYQAQIYKHMADQLTNQNKENVTSEMRSQNIILLSRSRDCLYLTLDRLREPSVDQKHPLNEQLGTEIEKIERLLSRIDPDCTNRNECDGMSDENVSSADSPTEHYVTGYSTHNSAYLNGGFTPRNDSRNHSTPYRSDLFKREAKPSPERLDAQLRQLAASKDSTMNHILEHNKIMIDSHKTLLEELRSFKEAVNHLTSTVDELKHIKNSNEDLKDIKKSVSELKASIDELEGFKNISDMVFEMKKEITELKKDINKTNHLSEEDIYGLANDYGSEFNLNSNLAAFNSNLYQNYPNRLPGGPSLYGPPALYPGMYPPLQYGYPGIGLPQGFPEQQLPIPGQDFRAISAALSQMQQPVVTYSQAAVSQNINFLTGQGISQNANTSSMFKDPKVSTSVSQAVYPTVPVSATPSAKAPPVNVVITSSDPLPTTKVTTTQPILSVTIPPQHLKGNIAKSQPHNYQIPLPTATVVNTSPSVLSKPPPAVSTQSILLNVAPPVYSAVSDSTNVTLSTSTEKTLDSSKNESLNKSNISTSSVEEHDPCPDFKPIIPLPDEVPVTTGEEGETVLFSEKAKLFRYASEAKEWRERGEGTIKILKNSEANKVRILMRRDQVLKICANHFLNKDMVLTAKNDRAYMWAANDFADETLVVEQLCVRFKTQEQAKRFADAFEKAKAELDVKKIVAEPDKNTASLGGFKFLSTPTFKPKVEPVVPVVTQAETVKASPFAAFTFGSTNKPVTPFPTNLTPKASEKVADSPHKNDDDESEEFVPNAEFKPVIPLPDLVEVKTGEENSEVLFETRGKLLRFDTSGEKKEWKEKGIGIIKLLKDHLIRLIMRREQVLKVCCNHQVLKHMEFKLVTNNPKAVMWCAKDFSDGVVKAETFSLKCKTEEIASDFLKAIKAAQESLDENHLVANKIVKTEIKPTGFGDKFKPVKGSWECKNCLVVNDGKVNHCVACDTPKNVGIPAKKTDGDASGAEFSFGVGVTTSWGSAFKPKEGSWECKVCYIRNDAGKTHCVSCESPKDDTVPKKETQKVANLQTTSKFSFGVPQATETKTTGFGDHLNPKEGSWECKVCYIRNDAGKTHCVSCESSKDDTVPKKETQKVANVQTSSKFSFGVPQATESKTTTGFGDRFKPKEGSWECKLCLVQNAADILYCVACESPKDETVPKKEPKGIDLSTSGQKFTFGFPSTTTTTSTPTSKTAFTFGQTTITPTAGSTSPFVFKPNTITPKKDSPTVASEKFVFGSPQKHDFEFTPRSPRRISSGAKDEESDASYVEEECDNIYFKPLIPLPDKVDVKTGEEDEDVLYSHRAKLYRFVGGEWKERGLGDIKILKRTDTGKLRVLMRREQVHKICLNHMLTSDIKYLTKDDDKTWLFTAPDYSEGEIVTEQFCLRFKNGEIAQDFLKAVKNALSCATSDTVKQVEDDSEVIFVSETIVTPEEEKEAIRLGLPSKFMAYRQKPDCQCEQCKKDDIYLKDLFKSAIPSSTTFFSPMSNDLKTPSSVTSSSSANSLFGTPKGDAFSFKTASDTSLASNTTLKNLLMKPSVLNSSKTNEAVKSTSSVFSSSSSPSIFSSPAYNKDLFGSKSTNDVSQTSNNDQVKNVSSTFAFGSTGIFGSAQKLTTTPSETKSTTGSVFGSGTSVFGGTNSIFGGAKSTGSLFGGTPTSTPEVKPFSASSTGSSIFGGSKSTSLLFGGTTPTTTSSNTSIFGTPKSETGSMFKSTGSLFGGTPSSTPATGSIFGGSPSIFGDSKNPIFGGGDSLKAAADSSVRPSFGASNATTEADAKTVHLKENDAAVLDSKSGVSFAALAATAAPEGTPAFAKKTDSKTKPFAFLGAGTPVFGAGQADKNKSLNKSATETQEEGGGDEDYDPHYEPIIPLPDAIVVSTGEEDEELLFNERAKLFRYDAENKAWKERGVGQMKILHHPTNKTYRFLLRREQVHKVVLNQLIIPDLELQPMATSDKAWVWAGYNYTEDASDLEKLAIRFKNTELAQSFFKVVQDVIEAVQRIQLEKKANISENQTVNSSSKLIPSSIQNYGVEDVSSDDQGTKGEYDEDDEDDDDDDDDRTIMFMKRCTLSEQVNNGWNVVGQGDLQIYYDPDLYAARICINNDSGEVISNTIIGTNTEMQVDKNDCMWKAVEWSANDPKYRTLKATFSNIAAAQEFHCNYVEGLNYAHEFDVVDVIPSIEPDETEALDD